MGDFMNKKLSFLLCSIIFIGSLRGMEDVEMHELRSKALEIVDAVNELVSSDEENSSSSSISCESLDDVANLDDVASEITSVLSVEDSVPEEEAVQVSLLRRMFDAAKNPWVWVPVVATATGIIAYKTLNKASKK